jgi:hypothetical protein
MSTTDHDKAVGRLLDYFTKLDFCHPETGAKMIFALV